MKYKMICTDMDGTLLSSKKHISDRNKEAMKKAQEAGVKVVLCTGRFYTSAEYYADLVGIRAPIISANGAFIREKDRNEVIYKAALGANNCKIILDILKKYDIAGNFHMFNGVFADQQNSNYETYLKMNDLMPADKKMHIELVEDWSEVFTKYEDEILKCIAINSDVDRIQKAKSELQKFDSIEVVSSDANNFEAMSKGVSKGRAVEILASFYNIDRDEVICIGDNENDLSMIEYAGLGIAMGNGSEEAKKAAKYITASNDEDGVAQAIEKFILS